MVAIYEAAKKNMLDCSEIICSSVAAAVSDADEGETTDATDTDTEGEQEAEAEQVEASTQSSDAALVSSSVGTNAAVVVALIALYLN